MDVKSKIKYTTIVNKYPSFRDEAIKSCWRWLEGRQEDDNAEGYWRVHDKLYNLTDFIKNHPGGSEWIALSKGTDITEAFESYHILPKASNLLSKFYVKDADSPRNYKLTYEDNGFYRVLKRRVAEKLPSLDQSDLWKSKFYLDAIVCGFLISSIMAIRADLMFLKIFFIFIASQCAAWMNAASHNFNHQRDSWRMYTANFILIGWRDWRVFHGMSHHLYPNSYTDLEISAYEPTFHWIPVQQRSNLQIVYSYVMTPLVYMLLFHSSLISRYYGFIYAKIKRIHIDELLILLPPTLMFIFGNSSLTSTNITTIIYTWGIILMTGSFLYSLMAVNAGHHGYAIVHEGDEFKSLDFGIYQMAATVDRKEANYNVAVSITHFGDHTLHHLFPSLDHALLPQLREILYETCKEFDLELRKWTLLHAAVEQFKQLARTKVRVQTRLEGKINSVKELIAWLEKHKVL